MGLEPTNSRFTAWTLDHFGIGHRIGGGTCTHERFAPAGFADQCLRYSATPTTSCFANCQRANEKTRLGFSPKRVYDVSVSCTGSGFFALSRVVFDRLRLRTGGGIIPTTTLGGGLFAHHARRALRLMPLRLFAGNRDEVRHVHCLLCRRDPFGHCRGSRVASALQVHCGNRSRYLLDT